jgi:delta 1-pyrroline-5-carboxylate dehydrogenase
MKYDIELLTRARDYCDMTIDDIMAQDAGHYETEAKRSLSKAIIEINNAIDLLTFYNAEE